jgi:uncharacterized protein YyaL (SSP411 family)
MPNRLADALSPYLRSHASNPVDWWQWGPEAFAEAERRDVPVLVSIGYSTCHWCHVMARESFSDPGTAAIINDNFVAIKVDREEHAEVDSTYLAAAGAFTPNLGWPLNVFVTARGRAFFAGTYWPPQPTAGHPSFPQVLDAVLDAWIKRRAEVESNGAAIAAALGRVSTPSSAVITDFDTVIAQLEGLEDREFGGLGNAPKFPVAPVVGFLVAVGAPLGERLLDAMASSALRDAVDGGFYRYATKRDWSEPHYERMLYDNAGLLASYALAGRTEVAEGIAEFLVGTLQLPGGGFASAQDSESTVDGRRVEGFYFTLDAASRARLDPPPLDEKVLTGWNGLAIRALAIAGAVLERAEWIDAARRAADFLLESHVGTNLVRASINGVRSTAPATLEDYGMLAGGLLELATATGEVRYAEAARELVDQCLDASIAARGPFGVPGGGDPVLEAQGIVAPADESDGAHPSGLSALADAADRLYLLTGHAVYRDAATRAMQRVAEMAAAQPISLGFALAVMLDLAAPVRQIVVVDDRGSSAVTSIARQFRAPGAVSVVVTEEQASRFTEQGFELFEGRTSVGGEPTAYVCENFVCRLPVTTGAALTALID